MDTWVWIVLVTVVVFLLLLRSGKKTAASKVNPTMISLDAATAQEIKAVALGGRKILAIKMLREAVPGLLLGDAKNIVERMMAQGHQPPPGGSPTDPGFY